MTLLSFPRYLKHRLVLCAVNFAQISGVLLSIIWTFVCLIYFWSLCCSSLWFIQYSTPKIFYIFVFNSLLYHTSLICSLKTFCLFQKLYSFTNNTSFSTVKFEHVCLVNWTRQRNSGKYKLLLVFNILCFCCKMVLFNNCLKLSYRLTFSKFV